LIAARAEALLQPGLHHPRYRVDRPAGREWGDDADGARRPALCPGREGRGDGSEQ